MMNPLTVMSIKGKVSFMFQVSTTLINNFVFIMHPNDRARHVMFPIRPKHDKETRADALWGLPPHCHNSPNSIGLPYPAKQQ